MMMASCQVRPFCSAQRPQEHVRIQAVGCRAAPNAVLTRRRAVLASVGAGALLLSGQRPARADEAPVDALVGTLEKTEEDIRLEGTELVKSLLQRSEQNRDRYKKELQEKYCYRQAEDGVGDCAGLRYIPGKTRSGKQTTPGWLKKIFGSEEDKAEGSG